MTKAIANSMSLGLLTAKTNPFASFKALILHFPIRRMASDDLLIINKYSPRQQSDIDRQTIATEYSSRETLAQEKYILEDN